LTHSPARSQRGVIQPHRAREIPRAVNTQVDVKRITRVELEKQVLANGVRTNDGVAVDQRCVAESKTTFGNSVFWASLCS
jgi:hypothetical protein